MMKKTLKLICWALILLPAYSSAQSGNAGIIYSSVHRPQFDVYISHLLTSLEFEYKPFTNTYGVDLAYSSRGKRTEFIFGLSFHKSFRASLSDDKIRSMHLNQRYVDFHTGLDYYPVRWFFAGGQLLLCSFEGKLKYENTGAPLVADTAIVFTEDSFNIFRGYQLGLRGESGFYIPINGDKSGIKIFGFYDLGLMPFNFYDSFDKVLNTYSGDKKTSSQRYGAMIQFTFPLY